MSRTATPSLAQRIAAYSAAAGVTIAAAPDTAAQIVYTDVDPDVTVSTGSEFAIDFDGDGTDDLSFIANEGGAGATTYRVSIQAPAGANALNGALGVDAPLFTNPIIGSASRLSSGAAIGPVTAPQGFYPYGVLGSLYDLTPYYQFIGTEGFVGFRFVTGAGTTHYGWMRVSVNNDASSGTVFEYAYESSADTPIEAGAIGVAIEPGPDGLPGTHNLSSIYPNPFNPQAQFSLEIAEQQDVSITLLDALGREVVKLHDGALGAGTIHKFRIDGANLPSGVYVVRAIGERFMDVRQVTLMK